jgi:hypothetical protein
MLTIARFLDGLPWLAISITLLIAPAPLALVHEIGHALVAVRRVPGRVVVRVGLDPSLTTFDIGRINFRLHPVLRPRQHDAFCLHLRPWRRADAILIALGGPAASFVAGGLAIWVASATGPSSTAHDSMIVIACLSLVSFVGCLVPTTVKDSHGFELRSDGGHVLDAILGHETFRPPVQRQWLVRTSETHGGLSSGGDTKRGEPGPPAPALDGTPTLRRTREPA